MVALPIVLAGSIGTYSDLKARIAEWLNRDDLTDRIPDFIALAEARFNRELRALNQEVTASFTTSSASYALPSDFRRLKRIWIVDTPNSQLVQVTADVAAERFDNPTTGRPTSFYLENRVIWFLPPPDAATTLNMAYIARITPLVADADSNWLLDEHPDLYLMAALLEAAVYIRDEDAVGYLEPRVGNTIEAVNLESRRDQWAHGPLAPQGPRQTFGARC